jgi:hypothetical protein
MVVTYKARGYKYILEVNAHSSPSSEGSVKTALYDIHITNRKSQHGNNSK